MLGILFSFVLAHAHALTLRATASTGFSLAYILASSGTRTESPLGLALSIEYSRDSRRTIGIEHFRAVKLSNPRSSGIGFTGFAVRWYPFAPHPQSVPDLDAVSASHVIQRGLSMYLGSAIGLATAKVSRTTGRGKNQVTITAESSGLYLSPKLGAEVPLLAGSGLRAELNLASTLIASGGSVGAIGLLVGGYWFF